MLDSQFISETLQGLLVDHPVVQAASLVDNAGTILACHETSQSDEATDEQINHSLYCLIAANAWRSFESEQIWLGLEVQDYSLVLCPTSNGLFLITAGHAKVDWGELSAACLSGSKLVCK